MPPPAPPVRRTDLVVFDVDGTLIVHPTGQVVWEVLNRRWGASRQANTERMQLHREGRLPYREWVRLDVEDWQRAGAGREEIVGALREFRLVEGAAETLATLQARGYRLAAVSGTIDALLDTVLPDHPFERLYCNRLRFGPGGAIVGWEATPFDFDGKARALARLSEELAVPADRIAFVGDDVNDVDAARAAAFSAAYRPRSEALAAVCDVVVRDGSLAQILPWFP